MKIWNLKFSSYKKTDDIFNFIINGTKTIETRTRNPNDGENDYSNVKVGDILKIKSMDTGKEVQKIVTYNHVYDTVEELVKNEDVTKILPSIKDNDEYLKVIEEVKDKWGEKYKFELEHYGIVAIGFK